MKICIQNLGMVLVLLAVSIFNAQLSTVFAQGTAFTYQGELQNNGLPAKGTYNLMFSLFNTSSGGSAIAGPVTTNGVVVSNGLFAVLIDFGPGVFIGTNYWLEIGVESNGISSFTTLAPRQQLTPTPYAIMANSASNLLGTLPTAQLTGTFSASQLSGTVPSANISGTYGNAVTFNNANNSFTGGGAGLTDVNAAHLNGLTAASFWQLTGNSGTTLGANYLGTSDNQALELHADGQRAFRLEPAMLNSTVVPNVIGGSAGNYVTTGTVGATIGGGGATDSSEPGATNIVDGNFGTISGGYKNLVSGQAGTVPGGENNVAGGNFSFAAGQNAQALNNGSFVWADDSSSSTFADSGPNQFLVRATGGVGINTSEPGAQLHVFQGAGSGQSDNFYSGGPAIFADTSTADGIFACTSVSGGFGVWGEAPSDGVGVFGDTINEDGTGVEGATETGVGVYAIAYTNSGSALTIGGGAIHISGAGTNTDTAAFIQVATAANSTGNHTVIANSLCDGDPDAILLVTPNSSPQGITGVSNNHPIGVMYSAPHWEIFEQDNASMPLNAAFNVLIIKN